MAATPRTPSPVRPLGAAPTSPTIGSPKRWAAAAPSVDALVQKAQLECETAEAFVCKVKNISDLRVGSIVKPNALGRPTGRHLEPDEVVEVIARCCRVQDGRAYLRLKEFEGGWVSTRSRKDFWKVVLQTGGSTPLEPAGLHIENTSQAAHLLPTVDYDGRRIVSDDQSPATSPAAAAPALHPWRFRVLAGRAVPILSHPSLSEALPSMPGSALKPADEFVANAVHIEAKDGRTYLRMSDARGWVCERSRADFSRFAVEPLHEEDGDPTTSCRLVSQENGKAIVIERKMVASPKAAPAKAERSSPFQKQAVVFRSDADLWPKALGAPRPITADTRTSLKRLAKHYGTKVRESQADLHQVEEKVASFAVACQGKKLLDSHADTLRKELAKAEQQWLTLVEKAIAKIPAISMPARNPPGSPARVAPVQVFGEPWHCATLFLEEDSDEEWLLGPLRREAEVAAEDLGLMTEACKKRKNGEKKSKNGCIEAVLPNKKQRVAPLESQDAD